MDFLCFYFPLFCIHWLMADYINAGKGNFLVSHAKKGYKTFRKGDKVQGVVHLFFSK